MTNSPAPGYSLTNDGIPFPPRLCFNWLPQYRYGLFAHAALQQACAAHLVRTHGRIEFVPRRAQGAEDISLHLVRPVLMDSVLRQKEHLGYVLSQAEDSLERFTTGELFHPLTPDLGLIVAKEKGSERLLNNILSYMTPAPQSIAATLAVAGGYAGASTAEIHAAHEKRKASAQTLNNTLRGLYGIQDAGLLRIHAAGVGGLIEAATRYMSLTKPGFRTCVLVPEYWDLLRCVLTYSPRNIRVIDGRERPEFPRDEWLSALSQRDTDFSYISYTNNPLGTTVPHASLLEAIDAIPNDALYFIDCTSLDTEESSSATVIAELLKKFPHKNLMITKSFSKEYNKGHLRVGYAVFTRREVAESIKCLERLVD